MLAIETLAGRWWLQTPLAEKFQVCVGTSTDPQVVLKCADAVALPLYGKSSYRDKPSSYRDKPGFRCFTSPQSKMFCYGVGVDAHNLMRRLQRSLNDIRYLLGRGWSRAAKRFPTAKLPRLAPQVPVDGKIGLATVKLANQIIDSMRPGCEGSLEDTSHDFRSLCAVQKRFRFGQNTQQDTRIFAEYAPFFTPTFEHLRDQLAEALASPTAYIKPQSGLKT